VVSDDAVALHDGAPEGREHEVADLLAFIKHAGIANTVWLTADMHYAAAYFHDPNKAVFQDFEPFWEFIAGPLHAGTWTPGPIDNTFGPRAVFERGCGADQHDNLAPCFGQQFFGHVAIERASEVMTVTLKDMHDRALWSTQIEPRPPRAVARRCAADRPPITASPFQKGARPPAGAAGGRVERPVQVGELEPAMGALFSSGVILIGPPVAPQKGKMTSATCWP